MVMFTLVIHQHGERKIERFYDEKQLDKRVEELHQQKMNVLAVAVGAKKWTPNFGSTLVVSNGVYNIAHLKQRKKGKKYVDMEKVLANNPNPLKIQITREVIGLLD